MRGLVYLLPIFFVLSCYGLDQIIDLLPRSKNFLFIFLTLFSLVSLQILSNDKALFLSGGYPIFPKEIGYSDYQSMYKYINRNFKEYTIVYVGYNDQPSTFWNVDIDYKLDFKNISKQENSYSVYYDEKENVYKQYYTDTPIITKRDTFADILNNKHICIILGSESSSFLSNFDIYKIENNLKLKKSYDGGYNVYCKD